MRASETKIGEEVRVGVFVCHCGINIGGVVDVKGVVEYARKLPGVVHAEENLYSCSSEGLKRIREGVEKHRLNRVVVAACTPRTHEPLFRATCEDAGLNKYLFEMANIREHCSWVHMHEPEKATEKARDVIKMAVARARLLEPQEEQEIEIKPSALVIGGGISGMAAALCLAGQGFEVYLVERESDLGGMLRDVYKLYPTMQDASDLLSQIITAVRSNRNVHVLTSTTIKQVRGFIGKFDVTIQQREKTIDLTVGTIIVATGSIEFEPVGLYGYKRSEKVVTQLQLERLLKTKGLGKLERVVFIQCVGAREEKGRTYCSRICCMTALKNAMLLKDLCPDAEIYILYRDLQTYGKEYEQWYLDARNKFIQFVNYTPDRPPEVSIESGKPTVEVYDASLGSKIRIDSDLVVLSTPLVPREDAKDLSQALKVPLGPDGFFFEAHVKLRPVDFATDGIYLCGTAHGPKDVIESLAQAYAAASRAGIPMTVKKLRTEAITAVVDRDLCIGCGQCEVSCKFGAHVLEVGGSRVIEALCKGCGVCAVVCPARAITMRHFKDEQILAQIREMSKEFEPRILIFACNWCSYAGADLAGVSRMQYPTNVRIVRTMCSGRVDPLYILEAFWQGVDGVLVTGCHPADCHYIDGNLHAERRVKMLKEMMARIGMEPERLRLEWVSASEGDRFATIIKEMTEDIRKLGPSLFKVG